MHHSRSREPPAHKRIFATMQIFLRTMTATWTFVVEPTDTVESLVKQVEATRGIPACHIALYFAGVKLSHDRTLADYGIPKESTLMMIARMAGG
jgi:hypothetical protein